MVYELQKEDFDKVEDLVKNENHELTIPSVIHGITPGEIYVDNPEQPLSALVKTRECNVIAGKADNPDFNEGIREKLDFFDQITCDNESWEKHISEVHSNIAIRKYVRRYYELDQLNCVDFARGLGREYQIEYVTADNMDTLDYENSDEIKEWIPFTDPKSFRDTCFGSYIRKGNTIVSMSMLDCMADGKVEIGIKTVKEYRRKGLGAIAAAATVRACLDHGITKIGWHCVDSNIGSIKTAEKVGFRLIKKYSSFTPFPPIENDTDLKKEQWSEWGNYYIEMNRIQPNYYWMAAQCFAKASNMEKAIENIMKLIESDQMCFLEYLPHVDAFKAFEDKKEWKDLMDRIK